MRPPLNAEAPATPERAVAAVTGARLLGGGDPPEPPAELAVVVALECVLAVEVLSVFLVVPLAADVDEEVGLGGAFAGGEEPVLVGATFEGVPEPTPGVGEVVTETDVGGNGEPVDTVAPAGVVEASALTGPTLASTDTVGTAGVGGTATVTVGTGAADACAMAVSDTMPDAHSGRRTDRERTRIARFKSVHLNILG